MNYDRRTVLIGLVAAVPLAHLAAVPVAHAAGDTPIMIASRVIVGRSDLDPVIGSRVEALLTERIPGFADRLARLAAALDGQADRDAALAGLDKDLTDTALAIARPWYLGFVGTPSAMVIDDDAEFVTFLQAQAFEVSIDAVPRPSLATGAPGWWADVPNGVAAPAMPADVRGWNFQPSNLAAEIEEADPVWLLLISGEAATVEEAKAKAGAALPAPAAAPQ